jgi:ribonuclease HI
MQNGEIIIHTDGGSRGNPGPAACAFVVDKDGEEIFKSSKFLSTQTNNFAEYSGVILALKWLISQQSIINRRPLITFFLDSELVVKQINGIYRVRDEGLRNLFFEVLTLMKKIEGKIIFKNVPREKNKVADQLVNQELDKNF